MDNRIRLSISAFFLVGPAVAIYLGHYHMLLPIVLLAGLVINTIGGEDYLGKIKDSHLYKLRAFISFFLGVFFYRALKDVIDMENILRSLFGYAPFTVTFIHVVLIGCLFELKYNIKDRRVLVSEQ